MAGNMLYGMQGMSSDVWRWSVLDMLLIAWQPQGR
jgi:hypothetical protein